MEVVLYEMLENKVEELFGYLRGFSLEEYENNLGTKTIDLSDYRVVLKGYWGVEENYESHYEFLDELHDSCLDPDECEYDDYIGRGIDVGNVILVGVQYYYVDRMGFVEVHTEF